MHLHKCPAGYAGRAPEQLREYAQFALANQGLKAGPGGRSSVCAVSAPEALMGDTIIVGPGEGLG